MKILIFSLAYHPFMAGAEIAVKEITDRIDDVKFHMVTTNLDGKQEKQEKINNVNVYRVGDSKLSKYFSPWSAFKKATELHQKNNYDAVWAIMANQAGLAALKFKKKFPDTRYILTLQEGDSLKAIWLRTWFMRKVYKDIFRKADFIQTISHYLKDRAIKYGYKKQIQVVPNGVAFDVFKNNLDQEQKNNLRKGFGLDNNEKIIISSSRLVRKNGLDIVIKAMKNIDATLVLLGIGKMESRLKSLAQELGLKHKVIFGGYIGHDKLPSYLSMADVFVRPSRSEGLGSAFLEAMAVRLPVVATKVGGIPDFLTDRETGLFSKLNDPRDLSEKINELLKNDTLRNQIITNAEAMVKKDYDWNKIALDMKNIFLKKS